MAPMLNVTLGFLLLQERFIKIQWAAVLFALAGMGYALAVSGSVPAFALALAFSFGFYGFSRKKIDAMSIPMLFIETLVLFIPALAYIDFRVAMGTTPFLEQSVVSLWCVGAGIVTSLPLLWFACSKAPESVNHRHSSIPVPFHRIYSRGFCVQRTLYPA